jgi:hypothetical protein
MKLLLCTHCQDIFKITTEEKKFCMCKRCWGQTIGNYKLSTKVRVSDNQHTVVLGVSNTELRMAVIDQPATGMGKKFLAFVIPKHCNTVEKEV